MSTAPLPFTQHVPRNTLWASYFLLRFQLHCPLVKRAGAQLALEDYGLSDADLGTVFSTENVAGPDRTTLSGLVALLRETYCSHIGVELPPHDVELRSWLQNRMESTRNRVALTHAERRRLLEKVAGPRCSRSSSPRSSSAPSASRSRAQRA